MKEMEESVQNGVQNQLRMLDQLSIRALIVVEGNIMERVSWMGKNSNAKFPR